MALKPTIYKIGFNLVDMNRDIYESERLTVALHPSETAVRMMVRVLAYALNYHADLSFTKGLSATEEPDLWQCSADGQVERWIEVGQASPERLRKAVSKAHEVVLYAYGDEVNIWWAKHGEALSALPKCHFYRFPADEVAAMAELSERNMELTLTISEQQIYVSSGENQLTINLETF